MAPKREWFRVERAKAKADSPSKATVHIYDEIDSWFGVDAAQLIQEIEALDVDELDVRINSPGGSAFDGINIANAIMRHKAKTTTWVDGLAASAASLIMVAADEVVVSKYAQGMLHNARAVVAGTAKDMREVAGQLDKLNGAMASLYADRAGGTAADWAKVMNAETWYDAEELVAAGLATRVDESTVREEVERAVASALACSSAHFKYPGREAAPAPSVRAGTTGARASVTKHPTKEAPVAVSEKVAERLGLAADATDEDVLAKIEALTAADAGADGADSGAEAPPADAPTNAGVEPGAAELAAAVASAAKAGGVFIPAERLQRLEKQAGEGAAALAAQIAAAHAAKLDAAIAQGKILPTERDKYAALMKADEATTVALLDQIPAEARAPISEIGHGTEPRAEDIADNPTYKNWSF